MSEVFSLLESVAPDYGATMHILDDGAQAEIAVTLPSGRLHLFELRVEVAGNIVSIREAAVGTKLPALCPDRHINVDGSFCLGWGDDDPGTVTDVATARRWWAAVSRFLAQQVNANKRGVFPGGEYARAHGDAAKHQAIAEDAAERLGPKFAANAKARRFEVRSDNRPGKPRLEFWQGGKRLARVSEQKKELVGGHTLCPCDASPPKKISDCGDHAKDLATFILALDRCNKADRQFLKHLDSSGAICCGTLRSCGLRQTVAGHQTNTKPSGKTHKRRSKHFRPPFKSNRTR